MGTKGIKKRLLSLVLTLAMVLALIPLNSICVYAKGPGSTYESWEELIAAEDVDEDGCFYTTRKRFSAINNPDLTHEDYVEYLVQNFTDFKFKGWEETDPTRAYFSSTFEGHYIPSSSIIVGDSNEHSPWSGHPGICQNCGRTIQHTCSLDAKQGQAATCTEDGWKDYYQCTGEGSCGKIYASNSTTGTSYSDLDAWKASSEGKIGKLGHDWGTTPTDLFNKIGTTTYAAYNETTHEHCVMKTYYDNDQNIFLLMNSTSAGINLEADDFTVEKSDVAGYDVLMSDDWSTFIYFALNENGDIKKIKFKDYELSSISASDKDVDDIKAAMPNEKFYAETMKDVPGYFKAFNYKNGEFLTDGGENIFSDTMFPITVDKVSNNTYVMWQGLSRAIIFELKDNKVAKIIYQSAYLNEYLPFSKLPVSKNTLYHNGDCKSVANGEHYVVLDYPQVAEIGMLFVQKYVNGKFDNSIVLKTTKDFAKSLKAGDILVENKNKEEQYEICPKASFTKETTHTHKWDKGTVTKKATYTSTGVKTFKCTCGKTKTETIAKLKLTSAAKYNNSTKLDAGFKVTSSTKSITVNWGKVAGADGYIVYAAYCGKDYKAIKTIKGSATTSYSFTKLDGKKLDLNKNFKVYVVAYSTIDGKKVQVGKTITGHIVGGKNRTYTNPTKVAVKNNKLTLSVNKTSKISATVTYKYANKKHLSDGHAAEKRYRSSNKAVATVDANGKITAVGKGTCTVYVFAKNGTSAKVTVTVK